LALVWKLTVDYWHDHDVTPRHAIAGVQPRAVIAGEVREVGDVAMEDVGLGDVGLGDVGR